MQKPVRYYIVQSEDQPVVRSVRVAVPREAAARPRVESTVERVVAEHDAGRARVARLMRAAVRRNRRRRHGH